MVEKEYKINTVELYSSLLRAFYKETYDFDPQKKGAFDTSQAQKSIQKNTISVRSFKKLFCKLIGKSPIKEIKVEGLRNK